MFLEQTRPHFLAKFKATCNKLGQKRHRYSVPKKFCALRYIIKYTDNNSNQNTYLVKFKTCPLKKKDKKKTKKIKTCFHICLEEKKNETAGLFPTFLSQGITQDK